MVIGKSARKLWTDLSPFACIFRECWPQNTFLPVVFWVSSYHMMKEYHCNLSVAFLTCRSVLSCYINSLWTSDSFKCENKEFAHLQKTRIKRLSMAAQTIISQFRVPVLLIPTALAEKKKQVSCFYETFLKKSDLEIEHIWFYFVLGFYLIFLTL